MVVVAVGRHGFAHRSADAQHKAQARRDAQAGEQVPLPLELCHVCGVVLAVMLEVIGHLGAVSVTIGGIGLRGARDDALDARRELGHHLTHGQDGIGRIGRVLGGKQRVHGGAEGIDV